MFAAGLATEKPFRDFSVSPLLTRTLKTGGGIRTSGASTSGPLRETHRK